MALPTFVSAGTGVSAQGDIAVGYPSSFTAGDLIILHAGYEENDPFSAPAVTGFTLIYEDDFDLGSGGKSWVYAKKATGSETGTVTVTRPNTGLLNGRMYAFRGWNDTGTLSDAFEAKGVNSGLSTTISPASITTLGADRLAVALVWVSDDNALDAFIGMSGGTWAEPVAEYTTTTGDDGALGIQTADKAATGTISGGSDTMSASDEWIVTTFAILPSAPVTPEQKFWFRTMHVPGMRYPLRGLHIGRTW